MTRWRIYGDDATVQDENVVPDDVNFDQEIADLSDFDEENIDQGIADLSDVDEENIDQEIADLADVDEEDDTDDQCHNYRLDYDLYF